MKVYKILHKPTGLFYTPSDGHGNLSTTGKIYAKKPNLSRIGGSIRIIIHKWKEKKLSEKYMTIVNYFNLVPDEKGNYWIDKHFEISITDWEIIEL